MLNHRLKDELKAAARRFPALANVFRPFVRFLFTVKWRKSTKGGRHLLRAATQEKVPGIGTRAAGCRIIMLLVSNIWIDPRVEREARALAAAGYEVEVICPDLSQPEGSRTSPDWGKNVRIQLIPAVAADFSCLRPGFAAGYLFEAAMVAAKDNIPLAFHAHDLNTCLAALAAARMTGAHLVADFHEWTSENVHWNSAKGGWAPYPADWKAELQALEARLMREASAVLTVCESIIDALATELGNGRRATLVRNIPALDARPTKIYPPLKEQLGLPKDRFVLLWQGGTGSTRLIEPIIEALAFAPKCTFVIRGPSLDLFGKEYQAIADRIGAGDRLILEGPVPSSDVVAAVIDLTAPLKIALYSSQYMHKQLHFQ